MDRTPYVDVMLSSVICGYLPTKHLLFQELVINWTPELARLIPLLLDACLLEIFIVRQAEAMVAPSPLQRPYLWAYPKRCRAVLIYTSESLSIKESVNVNIVEKRVRWSESRSRFVNEKINATTADVYVTFLNWVWSADNKYRKGRPPGWYVFKPPFLRTTLSFANNLGEVKQILHELVYVCCSVGLNISFCKTKIMLDVSR